RLQAATRQPLRMAVNVSVSQFRQAGFLATLDQALQHSGIAPERLELEITESVAMLDAEFMVELINHIKQRGVRIAIDDFGTGFSSLSYLQQLQVDRLKIDLSFIRQLEHNEGSRRIVESIVQLGHSLQLQLLAEGIEQASQARRLVSMGCQEGQGYWFARPMPLDDLLQLVEQRANGSLQLPQEIAL